jgi:hypothetical protein
VADAMTLFAAFRNVTCAPTMAPPVESSTVPLIGNKTVFSCASDVCPANTNVKNKNAIQ